MKKSIKKVLAFLMVFFIVVALVACAKDDDTPGNETKANETTETSEGEEKKEPLKFTVMGYTATKGYILEEGSYVEEELEKIFNMELTPVPVDIFDKEQVSVYLAANKTPDVMYFMNYDMTVQYIKSGIVREIKKEMIEENAPGAFEVINRLSPEGIAWELSSTQDGKLFGVPIVRIDSSAGFPLTIRSDWMEAVGITEEPKTIADLEYMFRKFRNEDPDKDGVMDTYGLAGKGYGSSKSLLAFIYGAYGILPGEMVLNDGKIRFADSTEDYKECLKLLQNWYKDGLLEPETPLPTNKYNVKFIEGITGSLNITYPYVDLNNPNSMWSQLVKNDPKAKQMLVKEIKGPKGYSGTRHYNVEGGQTIAFGINTDDEKVNAYLKLIDYSVVDKEGFKLTRGGKEGEHFTINADGNIIFKEAYASDTARADLGVFYYTSTIHDKMQIDVLYTKIDMELLDFAISLPSIPVKVQISSLPTYLKITSDLSSITEEFWSNAVSNKIDIDTEWDGYIKKLKDVGIEQIEQEAQVIYDKRINK